MLEEKISKPTFIKVKSIKIHYILKKKKRYGANFSIVFLCGYKSDVKGTKALFIDKLQKKYGFEFLRFDYSGHGASEGNIENGKLSEWIYESVTLIKKKTSYPTILIGSSMGGWISLVIAKILKTRIVGVIGIAAAPDFTYKILKTLNEKQKKLYKKNNLIKIKSDYDDKGYIFSRNFIEDSKKYFLLKEKTRLDCDVILLYGKNDNSVGYDSQLQLLRNLDCEEISLIVSRSSDHRMSSQSDLLVLEESIAKLL